MPTRLGQVCLVLSDHQQSALVVFYGMCKSIFMSEANSAPRKTPWKLSRTRKANQRARLKKVDAVIEAVRASGVQCHSLVFLSYSSKYSDSCTTRIKRLSCLRSMRCLHGTSTLYFRPMIETIVRAFIKYQNGQEYVA